MKVRQILLGAVGAAVAAGAAKLYASYKRDMRKARASMAAANPRTVETPIGPVAFAERDQGPAVLAVHGSVGGYDQGLVTSEIFLAHESGFRVIVPSRFGYPGTPMPADASAQAQADAHAYLLDALGIERAAIVGISGGGPSSIQFAMRHPDRCAALVLICAVSRAHHGLSIYEYSANWPALDFWFWLVTQLGKPIARWQLSIEGDKMTDIDKDWLDDILFHMYPLSERIRGTVNDLAVIRALSDLPPGAVTAPALVIHAQDDKMVPVAHARHAASRIPRARLHVFADGGHGLFNHETEIQSEVAPFLREYLGG